MDESVNLKRVLSNDFIIFEKVSLNNQLSEPFTADPKGESQENWETEKDIPEATLLPLIALGGVSVCIYYKNELYKMDFMLIPFTIFLISIKNSGIFFVTIMIWILWRRLKSNGKNLIILFYMIHRKRYPNGLDRSFKRRIK